MIGANSLRRPARWGAAVCGLVILALSLLPRAPLQGPQGVDKIEHAVAYFALAASVGLASFRGARAWTAALIALAVTAYGGVIEVLQGFVGRSPDLLDLACDAAGAIGGTLAAVGVVLLLRRVGESEQ